MFKVQKRLANIAPHSTTKSYDRLGEPEKRLSEPNHNMKKTAETRGFE